MSGGPWRNLQFPADANKVDSETNLAQSNCHDDGQTNNRHDGKSKEHNNRRVIAIIDCFDDSIKNNHNNWWDKHDGHAVDNQPEIQQHLEFNINNNGNNNSFAVDFYMRSFVNE
jgi:hypothetical protein